MNWANIGICSEVLEHVDDMNEFIKNCMYFLKKDALLILSVPGGPMSYYDHHIGHKRHFTTALLNDILNPFVNNIEVFKAGFPFYNLYRILRILRGKKLITDAKIQNGKRRLLVRSTSFVLRTAINNFSILNSCLGWQLFITGIKK